MGLDKEELTLKDVMLALANINSRLTAHGASLDEMAATEVLLVTTDEPQPGPSRDATETDHHRVAVLVEPHDVFDGMGEEVRCKVADGWCHPT